MPETAQPGALSRKRRRFALALTTCKSVKAAAAKAGIAERTAWLWLREPAVRAAANEALDAVLASATHNAAALMTQALNTLAQVMADQEASSSSRVSAARAILETGLRYNEHLALVERVAALEELLEKRDERPYKSR